jgi:hypothetical protein
MRMNNEELINDYEMKEEKRNQKIKVELQQQKKPRKLFRPFMKLLGLISLIVLICTGIDLGMHKGQF